MRVPILTLRAPATPARLVRLALPALLVLTLAASGCLQPTESADATDTANATDATDASPAPTPFQADWTFQADATTPADRSIHLDAPTPVTFSLAVDHYAGRALRVDLPGDCEDMAPFGDGPTVATQNTLGSTSCLLEAGDHELAVSVDGVVEGRLSVRSR